MQQTPVELNIQDLAMMRRVLDVVTQRGAIRADEMQQIGNLYAKLDAFLASHTVEPVTPAASLESKEKE